MAKQIIKVPAIGGAEGVEVIELSVQVGAQVRVDDSLLVLESDKASMEVPAPLAGTVLKLLVKVGDKVSEGDAIAEIETDAAAASATAPASAPEAKESAAPAAALATSPAAVAEQETAVARSEVISVPDLGGAADIDVIEVCVAVGATVAEGDSLLVLESDKASMEVPSPRAGKVTAISAKVGDKVSTGTPILTLALVGAAPSVAATAPPAAAKPAAAALQAALESAPAMSAPTGEIPMPTFAQRATAPAEKRPEQPVRSDSAVYAGPAVRKLARELGVALEKVTGSGPKGRVQKDDVQAFVKKALTQPSAASLSGTGIPAVPAVDFSQFGAIDIQPMSKLHKLTAANMHRSWLNVPHVTQFDDADITELEAFRDSLKKEGEQRGVKLTPLPFLLKAAAVALRANAKFNSSLHSDGESLVFKQYVHIGFAVDTPAGLVVPVIRNVDQKSLWELAAEAAELAKKAKDRKLSPAEMQGGCFTISSLGNQGGNGFTPIVNTPEVAILGVSRLQVKPVWNGKEFAPRKMLPLSLSYDHRVINGADAGKFFTFLNELLADIRRLLL